MIPTGLPAELIPHNFPEVETSGKEMLKQETFYEVQSWGCVSALLGLPAELIPQMSVPCLTTGVIIPALSRIVNHFRKIFPRKLKKAKQNPAQNIFPFCVGTFSSSCRCRGRVLFSDIGSPAFFFQEHRSIISSFLQANAIISMELHFRW